MLVVHCTLNFNNESRFFVSACHNVLKKITNTWMLIADKCEKE